MSVLSLTLLWWMNPTWRETQENWVDYFRRWRASMRKSFNTLGYSLWGPAQVARWLTFAGHLARMGDFR